MSETPQESSFFEELKVVFNSYQWRKGVAPALFVATTTFAGGFAGVKLHDFTVDRASLQAEFIDAKKRKSKFTDRGVRIGTGLGITLFTGISAYRRRP